MAVPKVATRDRILAAMRTVLARGGASAVTLESVAVEAGVSKGGLLYHFRSKEALYTGVLEASEREVAVEIAARVADHGPVRGFLEYSLPESEEESAYTSALIAAVRADEATGPDALDRLNHTFAIWDAPLLDAVEDPVTAELIRLVGHGLYLGAVAGMPTPAPVVLAALIERLVALGTPEPG